MIRMFSFVLLLNDKVDDDDDDDDQRKGGRQNARRASEHERQMVYMNNVDDRVKERDFFFLLSSFLVLTDMTIMLREYAGQAGLLIRTNKKSLNLLLYEIRVRIWRLSTFVVSFLHFINVLLMHKHDWLIRFDEVPPYSETYVYTLSLCRVMTHVHTIRN